MQKYLPGALADIEARVRFLKGNTRPGKGRCNATLVRTCRERLDKLAEKAQDLRVEPPGEEPTAAAARFREFRQLVGELDELESIAVQVLMRWDDADARANDLVERIAAEIGYPLAAPVVACQSREYYHIYPHLGLMLIPPAEGAFLLHLPDLYHELAHPLLTEYNDPTIEPFHQAWLVLYARAQAYVHDELQREQRRRATPMAFQHYLKIWRKSWRAWLVEFFCDVYAAHTLGPAFAWAHFHLVAKRGGDPFAVPLGYPNSHPADAARMDVVLEVLRGNGWNSDANAIEREWQAMLNLGGFEATAEYRRCFPGDLLQDIARGAVQATNAIGCAAASPNGRAAIGTLLNEAWRQFWADPMDYGRWQEQAKQRLDPVMTPSLASA